MYLVPFFDAAALSQAQRQLQKTIPAPPTQVPQITSKVCIRHQSHTTRSLFPSRHFSRFSLSLSLPFLSLIFFYLWKVNRVSLSNRLCRGSKSPSPCRVESSRTTPMRMRLRKKVIVNRGLWMKKGVTVASWQITHSFCFFFFFFFCPFFFLFPPPSQATLTFYLPAMLPRLPSHDNNLYCKQSVFPSPRCSIMAYKELR